MTGEGHVADCSGWAIECGGGAVGVEHATPFAVGHRRTRPRNHSDTGINALSGLILTEVGIEIDQPSRPPFRDFWSALAWEQFSPVMPLGAEPPRFRR